MRTGAGGIQSTAERLTKTTKGRRRKELVLIPLPSNSVASQASACGATTRQTKTPIRPSDDLPDDDATDLALLETSV